MSKQGGTWTTFISFVALNVLTIALAATLVMIPAGDYLRAQKAQIEERRFSLERQRKILAHNATLSRLLQSQSDKAATSFIQGDSPSLLNAELLVRLRRIAESRGVVFTSFAPLPAHDWSGRQMVGAKVEFSGISQVVSDLLADIEGGPCFLFIQRAHFATAKVEEADDTVSISLEIYGVTG